MLHGLIIMALWLLLCCDVWIIFRLFAFSHSDIWIHVIDVTFEWLTEEIGHLFGSKIAPAQDSSSMVLLTDYVSVDITKPLFGCQGSSGECGEGCVPPI